MCQILCRLQEDYREAWRTYRGEVENSPQAEWYQHNQSVENPTKIELHYNESYSLSQIDHTLNVLAGSKLVFNA